jgi:hypothetical protein
MPASSRSPIGDCGMTLQLKFERFHIANTWRATAVSNTQAFEQRGMVISRTPLFGHHRPAAVSPAARGRGACRYARASFWEPDPGRRRGAGPRCESAVEEGTAGMSAGAAWPFGSGID